LNDNPNYYIDRDQWGKYYNFTGNESPDTCFWCGAVTRQRYCTQTSCRQQYVKRFHWLEAGPECLRLARVGGRYWHNPVVICHDCSIAGYAKADYLYPYRDEWFYLYKGTNQRGTLQRLMEFEGITYTDGFQVHHVTPVLGEDRNWHWLNQYVVCLCKPCHWQRHKELNHLQRRYEALMTPPLLKLPKPQLSFIFMEGGGNG